MLSIPLFRTVSGQRSFNIERRHYRMIATSTQTKRISDLPTTLLKVPIDSEKPCGEESITYVCMYSARILDPKSCDVW